MGRDDLGMVAGTRTKSTVIWAALLLLLPTLSGCGGPDDGAVVVRGVVTIDGQPPPGQGIVYFTPIEPAVGFSCRPATGSFDRSGAFAAKRSSSADGLMPGRYQVAIHCWKVSPSMGGPPPVSYVDRKYRTGHTSDLELVVEPGKGDSMEVKYDLTGA